MALREIDPGCLLSSHAEVAVVCVHRSGLCCLRPLGPCATSTGLRDDKEGREAGSKWGRQRGSFVPEESKAGGFHHHVITKEMHGMLGPNTTPVWSLVADMGLGRALWA